MNKKSRFKRSGLGAGDEELEPLLRTSGGAFMECCRCLWKANGTELMEPFVDAAFNTLPEKSRSVLFQRLLTIVSVAQDGERQRAAEEAGVGARPDRKEGRGAT